MERAVVRRKTRENMKRKTSELSWVQTIAHVIVMGSSLDPADPLASGPEPDAADKRRVCSVAIARLERAQRPGWGIGTGMGYGQLTRISTSTLPVYITLRVSFFYQELPGFLWLLEFRLSYPSK